MKPRIAVVLGVVFASSLFTIINANAAAGLAPAQIEQIVNEVIKPILKENDIPGMAVSLTYQGEHYFYNYGVASKESGSKVTKETLFELGSVSKTFAATLASYAQVNGLLSLNDNASHYFPALAGSSFDKISLLNLGTYTAGGLPLQFPDDVDNQAKMIAYYKSWQPLYAAGTYRQYSNPSLGLFGYLAAKSLGGNYEDLLQQHVIEKLGLSHTYFHVPQAQMNHYAYGYSKQGEPIRVNPGVLDAEAYGLKSNSEDMINYVAANINTLKRDGKLQQAIRETHTGYFKVDEMIQGLGWEFYSYPTTLERLLTGNSSHMAMVANKATALVPPQPPIENIFINKTGSTNGFGAYVAFIPSQQLGIVMLANKNYPNDVRVTAAYRILSALK